MIHFGKVKPGSTLYIPFDTFDGGTGASITMTGLAVTDIEIYRNGSVTQRASDTGYTLLDTDGIDFDALTGIHGFSIDLSSNADSGFFVAGGFYWVVVSAITVDAQTVSFVAATFAIGYEGALLDTTIATLASQTSFTLTAGPAEDDALNGCTVVIHDIASAVQMGKAIVQDYTGSTRTVTLVAGVTFTAAAGDNISVLPPALQPSAWGGVEVVQTGDSYARLGAPAGASVSADIAAIEAQTDDIGAAGAGLTALASQASVDTIDNLLDTEIAAIITTLGTPAGASISADIAAIEAQTDDIGAAGAGLTALPWNAAWDAEVESEVDDALGGGTGTALTAVPWNAAWDAEVQSEVDDALVARNLNSLVLASGTADSGSTTTMVDAARTEADADYWKGRLIVFTSGNIAGQCAIITDFNAGTDTFTFAPALTQAVATQTYVILPGVSVWDDTLAEHLTAGTTGAALNSASAPSAATIADAVWDEALAGHLGAGSTGEALNAAGAAGDPWVTALPGAYGAGSAGNILGNRLVGTIATGTHNPQSGDAYARLGAPAGASVSADILAVDNLVDDLESRLGTPSDLGSGATVAANLVDIESQTDDIGAAGAGLTAADDAVIAAIAALNNLSQANIRTAVGLASANLDTQLDALPTAAENADAVWDEDATAHQTQGTFGQAIGDPAADTDTIYALANTIAGNIGTPSNLGGGATIAANLSDIEAQTDDIGAAGAGLTALATQASVNTIDDLVDDLEGRLTAARAGYLDNLNTGVALTAAGVDAILDEVVEGSYTFRQFLRLFASALGGELSGAATTTIVIRDASDTKTRITATVDAVGNRSAVTLDLT